MARTIVAFIRCVRYDPIRRNWFNNDKRLSVSFNGKEMYPENGLELSEAYKVPLGKGITQSFFEK